MQNIPNQISDIFCIGIVNEANKLMLNHIKKGAEAPSFIEELSLVDALVVLSISLGNLPLLQ